jgi:hypothetical protein
MTIEARDSKFNSNSAGETPRLVWVKIVPEPLFFKSPFSKKLPNKKPIIAPGNLKREYPTIAATHLIIIFCLITI